MKRIAIVMALSLAFMVLGSAFATRWGHVAVACDGGDGSDGGSDGGSNGK